MARSTGLEPVTFQAPIVHCSFLFVRMRQRKDTDASDTFEVVLYQQNQTQGTVQNRNSDGRRFVTRAQVPTLTRVNWIVVRYVLPFSVLEIVGAVRTNGFSLNQQNQSPGECLNKNIKLCKLQRSKGPNHGFPAWRLSHRCASSLSLEPLCLPTKARMAIKVGMEIDPLKFQSNCNYLGKLTNSPSTRLAPACKSTSGRNQPSIQHNSRGSSRLLTPS